MVEVIKQWLTHLGFEIIEPQEPLDLRQAHLVQFDTRFGFFFIYVYVDFVTVYADAIELGVYEFNDPVSWGKLEKFIVDASVKIPERKSDPNHPMLRKYLSDAAQRIRRI